MVIVETPVEPSQGSSRVKHEDLRPWLSVIARRGPAGRGEEAAGNHRHLPTTIAYRDRVSDQDEDAAAPLEPHLAAAVVDVFVYVVVLNLFVEYLPQVFSETFTLSLLTAVLLKGVLEVVVAVKNRVKSRFRQASTPIGKVVAAVMLWVVLFGSKFLVLEAVNLVFGDRVSLQGVGKVR